MVIRYFVMNDWYFFIIRHVEVFWMALFETDHVYPQQIHVTLSFVYNLDWWWEYNDGQCM